MNNVVIELPNIACLAICGHNEQQLRYNCTDWITAFFEISELEEVTPLSITDDMIPKPFNSHIDWKSETCAFVIRRSNWPRGRSIPTAVLPPLEIVLSNLETGLSFFTWAGNGCNSLRYSSALWKY